jgi:hypothetical protein
MPSNEKFKSYGVREGSPSNTAMVPGKRMKGKGGKGKAEREKGDAAWFCNAKSHHGNAESTKSKRTIMVIL